VARLEGDASTEARAAIARKLGRQYDELARSDRTGPLAGAILNLLVKDVERNVRASLATAIARSSSIPPSIAAKLARDEIEVAGPILERSPVLDDEQLVEIVRTHAMQYALAIAGRQNLAEMVSEALVETAEGAVVAKLVGNAGARLSDAALARIVDDFLDDQDVQDRLVRRPELPYHVVERLVGAIGQRLEWELVRSGQVSSADAQALISAIRDQAAISMTAREHDAKGALATLRQEHQDGALDPMVALRALKNGEIARFEGAISILAGEELPRVRGLLYGMDKRGVAAICLRAAFGAGHYLAVRMALDLAESGLKPKGQGTAYTQDTLRFLQSQYEQMRTKPDLIQQLVEGA
jgi:uncharacterized protein (DUF2336 family)